MDLNAFLSRHSSALIEDQARHNLILGILERAEQDPTKVRIWSLGEGTACAVQTPPHFIVLGDLDESQCESLAQSIVNLDFLGCVGPGDSTDLLVRSLENLGVRHKLEMPQRIYVLDQAPHYPMSEGTGRPARPEDSALLCDWLQEFQKEAIPNEPPIPRERLEVMITKVPFYLWEVSGKAVSMAARNRETPQGSNISSVYTPPELRGRGFAGSVTAYASECAFREGKKSCFLYTDLSNPISNRVYTKIGFRPWCDSKIWMRVKANTNE